jgi:hypothetical protein
MLCPAMLAGNFISACWRGQPKPIRAHDRSGPATKHWVCVHGLARVIPRAGRSMPTCSSSRPTCRASALSRRRSSASARALSASSSARTQSRAGGALLVPKSRKEPRARCAPPHPPHTTQGAIMSGRGGIRRAMKPDLGGGAQCTGAHHLLISPADTHRAGSHPPHSEALLAVEQQPEGRRQLQLRVGVCTQSRTHRPPPL